MSFSFSFPSPFPAHRQAVLRSAIVLCGLAGFAGCAPSPASHVSAAAPRTSPSAVPAASLQATLIHVHSLPLYQKAEQACKAKCYAQAAGLLQRLGEQKGLPLDESAFVQQQRVLCLQDAGLPVPASTLSSKISSAAASKTSSALTSTNSLADADCGPRALLLLCNRLGIKTTLSFLRQKAGTTPVGTSLAGLATAAQAVGLKAEGVQVSREALQEIDLPAIGYVNGNHFVEVAALAGKGEGATATIHDSNAAGEETISQERLLRLCSGYLLLVKC